MKYFKNKYCRINGKMLTTEKNIELKYLRDN